MRLAVVVVTAAAVAVLTLMTDGTAFVVVEHDAVAVRTQTPDLMASA
jgi:hypothetical protein